MACSPWWLLTLSMIQMTLLVTSVTLYPSSRQNTAMYYLAYCPIRQGNYITYSNAMCYCRRGGTTYDCRPVAGSATVAATQRPQTPRPSPGSTATLPPLKPPPVAPPPPPPPNRPSTPPNVDTRPETLFLFQRILPRNLSLWTLV